MLPQCTALAHLDLGHNEIGNTGAESLAEVLAQCPALAQLNLIGNEIGTVGNGRLQASWRGQASGLVLVAWSSLWPCFVEEESDGLDEDEDEDEDE